MNSIVEAFAMSAADRPDTIAVIAEEQKITYAELWREVRGFAAYLHSLGIERGARVVVKASHSIWYVVSCLGIHLAGCAHVPLESTIGIEAMKQAIMKFSASLLISDIDADVPCLSLNSNQVRGKAVEFYDEHMEVIFPKKEEIGDIIYTTGTTGKQKGVVMSHGAIMAGAENLQSGVGIREGSVYLIAVPVNHTSGIRKIYVTLYTGTTVVLLDGFSNVKKYFRYIRDYGVTSLILPPSAVRLLLLVAEKELGKYDGQLDYIQTGSAVFPEADKERMIKLLPHTRLLFSYGSGEAANVSIYNYSKHPGKICCVGKPNKHVHVFFVDEDRNRVEATTSAPGLVAISGPMVMEGYFNDPELTAKTLVDGVVYTNDIGYIDEEGYLYVMGRRDDVINVGGLKIAPTEVEGVVLRFPGVAECVCFPVKDRLSGVSPKLNIVEEAGANVDVAALREYMLRHLEAYKVPKQIEKVASVLKTPNGKIDRKIYRA